MRIAIPEIILQNQEKFFAYIIEITIGFKLPLL